ncbi:Bromodomain containing protein [Pyrenophora tritici-repentis]|nr:Bromodomain containing protein [Pyrenophora tritici-repentis]
MDRSFIGFVGAPDDSVGLAASDASAVVSMESAGAFSSFDTICVSGTSCVLALVAKITADSSSAVGGSSRTSEVGASTAFATVVPRSESPNRELLS